MSLLCLSGTRGLPAGFLFVAWHLGCGKKLLKSFYEEHTPSPSLEGNRRNPLQGGDIGVGKINNSC